VAEHGSSEFAAAEYWDRYFVGHREAGTDLDWEGTWTNAFLPRLLAEGAARVLELGCGTGNDAARIAREGLDVSALDFSREAIEQAQRKFAHLGIRFLVGDIAEPLDFEDGAFDAVMSNVALHMFPDTVTRAAFAEIERVVRHGGLFLCHVNALEDRPLRERRRPVRRELEPNYVLEEAGQTMRFFSREYLTELLCNWEGLELQLIELRDRDTGEPFKCVWRVVARRS
jgi:SAM-dependent methyltransferase